MRPIDKDGKWGAKSRKKYILNDSGERIKLPSGEWKSRNNQHAHGKKHYDFLNSNTTKIKKTVEANNHLVFVKYP